MKTRASPMLMLVGAGLMLGGCQLLPEPQADPTRTYILDTSAAGPLAEGERRSVVLRPIEVAGYLRDRSLVVRRGENEIERREFAIWAEPLEQGIARVLREELLRRGIDVSAGMRGASDPAELRVRVLQSEGGADGRIHFRAGWEIQLPGGAAVRRGTFEADEALRWDGKTEAQLAARLSEAVAALAGELAGEIKR